MALSDEILIKCKQCDTTTNNPVFCSKSCAARYNNKLFPKRLKKSRGFCTHCGKELFVRAKTCATCREKYSTKQKTIGELREKEKKKGRHTSWLHHEIRSLNRYWNKNMTKMPCKKCGYSIHVELAHKIPLHEYPDNTLLETVNDPSNQIPLCRNCHWELDHGLIKLDQI
jgi:hypothetical protein